MIRKRLKNNGAILVDCFETINGMQLSGTTVLIAVGTAGVGLVFAEKFWQAGSKVIVTGRREKRLKKIEEDFPVLYQEYQMYQTSDKWEI